MSLISISIVSHNQANLLVRIIEDLVRLHSKVSFEVLLTKNVPEAFPFNTDCFEFPVEVIENSQPKGFGANHNAAFRRARGEWFCVMNPDISLPENPFPPLIKEMALKSSAVVAPAVLSPIGQVEDSIRRFPTLLGLVAKLLGRDNGLYPFSLGGEAFATEWAAGMFMLFRAEDFIAVGGFDEKFFMYYEDVDICVRLWNAGRPVLACPKAQVIHDARRTSRRRLRYLTWHIASMARYFWKHWGRLPRSFSS